eukprot:TRINITY_DN706_c0_g1_i17.p1 TRINITY_DN706_c0_g1~~TRINITY_DN706_c0_g1_i17.p1  ORF type:complete len:507 (+),score=102.81 TRINITY_DN706_c0_g1_i17:317-1837(+)
MAEEAPPEQPDPELLVAQQLIKWEIVQKDAVHWAEILINNKYSMERLHMLSRDSMKEMMFPPGYIDLILKCIQEAAEGGLEATGVQKMIDEMTTFGRLCRQDPVALNFNVPPQEHLHALEIPCDNDHISRVTLTAHPEPTPGEAAPAEAAPADDPHRLVAVILPNKMCWPLFRASKQREMTAKHICFDRQQPYDQGRIRETVENLLHRHSVVWLGDTGIGKSAATNLVLIDLLKQLGKPFGDQETKNLSVVALRVDEYLIQWSLVNDDINVELSRVSVLADLLWLSRKLEENGVLLVELKESEKDLEVACPTFFTISCRDAHQDFKSFTKLHCPPWMLVDPWTVEQSQLAACVLFLSDKQAQQQSATARFSSTTIIQKVSELFECVGVRFSSVGGLIRTILGSPAKYEEWKKFRQDVTGKELSIAINDSSVYSVPREAKYFFGPVIKPGPLKFAFIDGVRSTLSRVVQGTHERRFHSAECAILAACLLYTSPSPRDRTRSRMPSSA